MDDNVGLTQRVGVLVGLSKKMGWTKILSSLAAKVRST